LIEIRARGREAILPRLTGAHELLAQFDQTLGRAALLRGRVDELAAHPFKLLTGERELLTDPRELRLGAGDRLPNPGELLPAPGELAAQPLTLGDGIGESLLELVTLIGGDPHQTLQLLAQLAVSELEV
jgi:hypothetical protein